MLFIKLVLLERLSWYQLRSFATHWYGQIIHKSKIAGLFSCVNLFVFGLCKLEIVHLNDAYVDRLISMRLLFLLYIVLGDKLG